MAHRLIADTSATERVLVGLFFWRGLDLEGGAALIRALAESLPTKEHRLSLLLPEGPRLREPAQVNVLTYRGRTRLGTLARYLRRLRQAARQHDRVVLFENNPAFHLLLRVLLPRAPPLVVHFSSPCVEGRPFAAGANRQSLLHWLTKSALMARLAARVVGYRDSLYVVSSEFQRQQLLRLGAPPSRLAVAPFGAPAMSLVERQERSPGSLVLGYLGHFSPVKGVPDLLRAANLLLAEGLPLELRIAWSGKGSEEARVRRLLAESSAPSAIRLEGEVDVGRFLSEVDLVVLPLRSESFPHPPLVLVEALAAGVPLVTSDAGALPELLAHGRWGATFPSGDWRALADLLRQIWEHPQRLVQWRRRISAEASVRYDSRRLWSVLLEERAFGTTSASHSSDRLPARREGGSPEPGTQHGSGPPQ